MDTDQFKSIIRRLNNIENTQNIQDKEREILEDILLKLNNIDDRLKLVEENAKRNIKDLKADIGDVGQQVVGSLDDLITEIDNTPIKKMDFFGKIRLIFTKKGGK